MRSSTSLFLGSVSIKIDNRISIILFCRKGRKWAIQKIKTCFSIWEVRNLYCIHLKAIKGYINNFYQAKVIEIKSYVYGFRLLEIMSITPYDF